MSQPIPRMALWLGLAGLLPMVWGVAETYIPAVKLILDGKTDGWYYAPYSTMRYAEIILCFMSGVLWGFAARAPAATAGMGYALSVLPALYVFFFVNGTINDIAIKLAIGFALVLCIDALFHAQKLTPEWWMRLRYILSAGMVVCLLLLGWVDHR
ncbi:MAG: DUF3429 domain-containing protein [Roseovarius sp.]